MRSPLRHLAAPPPQFENHCSRASCDQMYCGICNGTTFPVGRVWGTLALVQVVQEEMILWKSIGIGCLTPSTYYGAVGKFYECHDTSQP